MDLMPENLRLPDLRLPRAAYIHIPFCRRRCYYCDFPISVLGDRVRGEASLAITAYLQALNQEIILTATAFPSTLPLSTIYFGGGTPSLLDPSQIAQILETLRHYWGWEPTIEISLEVDPGTFTLAQLQGYRAAGVTRLSLGVQSFAPDLLVAMGRTHTAAEITQAAADIWAAGFENWSLDLISGLPNQTLPQWQQSLQAAIALAPTHLSCYDLVVEPGTVYGKRYRPGDTPLPSDELAAQMYRLGQVTLTAAGYRHYEISNFGQSGYLCRHNQVYWHNHPYYGFGMGATSYLDRQRFSRPRTRADYYAWLQAWAQDPANLQQQAGTVVGPTCEPTTVPEGWLETLMLGLRLAKGVSWLQLAHFPAAWLDHLRACLQPHQQAGWVIVDDQGVRLTDPEGFLYSNQVLVTIWEAFEQVPS
jgi:putative oxygen-independent coproporphyrinogen III oxidase